MKPYEIEQIILEYPSVFCILKTDNRHKHKALTRVEFDWNESVNLRSFDNTVCTSFEQARRFTINKIRTRINSTVAKLDQYYNILTEFIK